MNEVRAILAAFDAATARGERCALATVVNVEGSAYRRPGARMLVCEGGSNTGTISAGCLEGDVIEHARRVVRVDTPKLLEFDTGSAGDEVAWGLGLGCAGIVRVLVEPLAPTSLYVRALRSSGALAEDSEGICVATVFRASRGVASGARLLVEEGRRTAHERMSDETASKIETEIRPTIGGALRDGMCSVRLDGATVDVFIETLRPPMPIVVFGAGPDVLPVVELAHGLGWHIEVVDPQARPASRSRFALADRVTLSRPEDVAANVSITPRTLAVLMSHNYSHDLALLHFLLRSPARYIGVMGPRSRTERMLSELAAVEDLPAPHRRRLHAPVGLDIGADGPVEIALSIVAEMRAVLDGRSGGMLRERHRTTRLACRQRLEPRTIIDDVASQTHAGLDL